MEKVSLRDMTVYADNIVQMIDEDTTGWNPVKRHFLFTLVAERVIRALGDEYFYSDEFEHC